MASCYRSAMSIAADNCFASLDFLAISTGIYGFPTTRAAEISVQEIRAHLDREDWPKQVVLCCFGGEPTAIMREALTRHG